MNLFEFHHWERTKIWLALIVPTIIIFLFINPYISLFLFCVVLIRLSYVKVQVSIFNKSADESEKRHHGKIDEWGKSLGDWAEKIKTAETDEILDLTNNFPYLYVDFDDSKNEYIINYKNKTVRFQNYQEIRKWLESSK